MYPLADRKTGAAVLMASDNVEDVRTCSVCGKDRNVENFDRSAVHAETGESEKVVWSDEDPNAIPAMVPAHEMAMSRVCRRCAAKAYAEKTIEVADEFSLSGDADLSRSAEPGFKYCGRCNYKMPLSDFGKNASAGDGLQRFCKQCNREAARRRMSELRRERRA